MKICDVVTEASGMSNWYDKKSKAQFKRDELEYELRHEKDQDTGPFYLYKGKDYDSRKLVKGRDGQPFVFHSEQALSKAVNTMSQKPFNKGMKFWKSRSAQESENTTSENQVTETTSAGGIAVVAKPMGKMIKRSGVGATKKKKKTNERELSKAEIKKRDKYAEKDLPDAEFKKRYGKDWENVKWGTATNMAKKK